MYQPPESGLNLQTLFFFSSTQTFIEHQGLMWAMGDTEMDCTQDPIPQDFGLRCGKGGL